MALFKYAARKLSGQLVEGQMSAASRNELSEALSRDGMVLVSAKSVGQAPLLPTFRGRRVRGSALAAFVREFRALAGAGMPLAEALARLEVRKDDPLLSAAIADTRRRVEQGRALDEAMAETPGVFDPLFQATVRAGLATGQLDAALERLLAFIAIRQQLQRKVKRALNYPIFLLTLLVIVLAILMLFVLPRFADLYDEFGAELPWLTRMLIRAVETAPIWISGLVLAALSAVLIQRVWLSLPAARLSYDRLRLSVPGFGGIARETGLVQASFVLSMLLSAGTPLRDALRFAQGAMTNAWQAAALGRMEAAVGRGQSLSKALRAELLFPELSISLIEAGEQAGDLDRMFAEVAKLHEDRLDDRLSRAIAWIEPGMMLLVGIVLGTVIVAVYLPIFGISTVIQ